MRRALALLFIFIIVFSHGGVSEALPHSGDHAPAAHSHALAFDSHDTTPDQGDPEKGLGHASHSHAAADLARLEPVSLAAMTVDSAPFALPGAGALPSRGVSPLLEPPAA